MAWSQKFWLTPDMSLEIFQLWESYSCSDGYQRWPQSLFQTPTPFLFQNFWIPARILPAISQICKSDSCSDPGYNHRSNHNLPMFLLKKLPHRLLLLPKLKSDSWSGSGFSQNFVSASGYERKTPNPVGVDCGTADPEHLWRLPWIQPEFAHDFFWKCPHNLLLLLKSKIDSGSGFSQIFDS